jgi:hypothetical protein
MTQQYPDGLVCTTPVYIQIGSYAAEPGWKRGLFSKVSGRIAWGREKLIRRN